MLKFIGLFVVVVSLWGSQAAAVSFENCKNKQEDLIAEVLPVAEEIAARAAASVADTPEYERWFGMYSEKYSEEVRANLKAIHRAIAGADLEFVCGQPRSADCDGVYAFVYTTEPYVVTLCPSFFDMPQMEGGSASDPVYENGTRAGTIIHEISHFEVVAGTDDVCYSRGDCTAMARHSPDDAVINADTYQYFAEDVTFSHWGGATGPAAEAEVLDEAKP